MLMCRQEMIRLLSPLALQVVPSFVLTALRQLSTNLPTHIAVTFSTCSQLVIQAKLAPATIFASLVDRLLRVNDAAHAAARFLGNPPDREQMVKDWQAYVNPQMIIDREIPCHAPSVKHILESEISNLLQPGYQNGTTPTTPGVEDGATTESVLDKWTNFLTNLPERFGEKSPRYFNICLGAVASAALRDLTTNGAISFGSWWVVRCWIDEWMSWQAERGGFLNHGIVRRPNNKERKSVEIIDLMDTSEDLGPDDEVPPLREEHINLLEDVGDDRDNRMVMVLEK
jgi:regulatory factor X